LVSRQGWARFSDGWFVVAAQEQGRLRADLLKAEKARELEKTAELAAALEARERELETRRTELDRQVEEAREAAAEAGQHKSLQDARLEAIADKRQELERDRKRILADSSQLGGAKGNNLQAFESVKTELAEIVRKVEQQSRTLAGVEKQVREQEQEARAALERAAERLAALNEQRQQVSRIETEGVYARRQVEERGRRVAELERTIVKAGQDALGLRQEADGLGPEIDRVRRELEGTEARADALSVADLATVEEELERNLAELRKAREQNQSILMEQRMREHELGQRRRAIEDEARTGYKTEIAEFQPGEMRDVVARLAQVRQRISALGAVNPLASEDCRREKDDLERVIGQRNDVVMARDNLVQTMLEIDRHAKERFLETYGQVRTHFQEIFRQMFLEGDADIVLADEARPLESEVAIIARPRGKNPKRLEQLSDGEKALLAVSLLFAFYRVKPAPFCFLDEIDAPLDDANVGRFSDYLKELSRATQVIVITHNRLTVERAETLFGVTAEQPGVSKLVSVSLADYQSSPAAAAVN
jgi:chromosome segregation protein